MIALQQHLDSPYQGYVYGYPHKSAYRPFERPLPLRDLWQSEDRRALFLYAHVPFCEMRCGFCNLFTQARPKGDLPARYIAALQTEAAVVREALADASFARLALGGGTPTFLDVEQLTSVFDIIERIMGADVARIPTSVETSPATAGIDKLQLLRGKGVDRISIGVQSFVAEETSAAARPQEPREVRAALQRIRALHFPTLNIDLIYGLPGQTRQSWLSSLQQALQYRPEELYLYPLYVRPLTSLGKSQRRWDDARLEFYCAARDFLLSENYEQISMRLFRAMHAPAGEGPVYCCQNDGMVGLGCGARSYTRGVHYSGEYAVGFKGVREILAGYIERDAVAFAAAHYGFQLSKDEQRRRFALQSLLQCDGLSLEQYAARFGTEAFDDLPQLHELKELRLAKCSAGLLRLTEAGLERSDAIGPWLYSQRVRQLMADCNLR